MPSPSKWFYVTGCDTGFGNVVVKKLDNLGYGVFAGVFLPASMTKLEQEGNNIVPVPLDVTKDDSVENAAALIEKHLKSIGKDGLDGVVNNAGILVTPGPVEWTPIESYKRMMDVNVFGMVRVVKSVLPLIRAAKGRIVNVASIAGRIGLPSQPAYSASKYAVEGYSEVLRRDMLPWDVTVSVIEPGVFHTTGLYDRFQTDLDKLWDKCDESTKKAYGNDYYKYVRALIGHALNMAGNSDNNLVPNAMIHALTESAPQYRYRVGPDSKYAITLIEKMHESTQDTLLCGLDDPRLPRVHPATAPRTKSGKPVSAQRKYEKNWFRFLAFIAITIFAIRKLKTKI